ncbi:Tn3 family transposase [Candidatus Regiella insecticola]|uniref:Tn3 family transposase n=1 Tax=Candidatus Regiella insecticola TaxID=138073 RepID=UPI001C3F42C6|nr:Tn3 family transposase [Candidatus Regiella insecticola]
MKRNLRPLFKVLEFSCENEAVHNAAHFLHTFIHGNKSFYDYSINDIPLDFFPKSLKRFIMKKSTFDRKKRVDVDRYEFMVYWQLQKGLDDISVHIRDSYFYRALEDELLDIEYWETHKKQLLEELNMPLLSSNIVDILATLEESIENKYQEVNRRIISGENTGIKLKYNTRRDVTSWTLPYIPLDKGTDNPFFKKLPTLNISDIAQFVNGVTGYSRAFSHLQPIYAKEAPETEIINACVIANATGTEMKKMKDISDIDAQSLKNTQKNFIRPQTLSQASDMIINQTEQFPIFKEYNLSDYGVHASVDGQKFTTRFNTIKSRHAKKYFGLKKGVVVMTLNANMLPICLKVIGANEHESHYLLDLVESNNSEINIAAVSGDMHSINRVNFALMYIFGYRFMPRFTQLANTSSQKLVCFGNLADYDKDIIHPSKKARKHQIISEWDKVLRILVSLALKKTTQANIVRKLSTTKSTNPTLKALIALDEIIMTDYLLGYIDDKDQRTAVQRSLNRGESYHQLASSIAKVNGGKQLSGKKDIDLTINAESIRLIANIIIHHNATILSALYQHYAERDPEKCQEIIHWSPVAWRFVNLIGNYEFYRKDKIIDIQKVIENIISNNEIDFSPESLE